MSQKTKSTSYPLTFLCIKLLIEVIACANNDGLQRQWFNACAVIVCLKAGYLSIQKAIVFLCLVTENLGKKFLALSTYSSYPKSNILNQIFCVAEISDNYKHGVAKCGSIARSD